MQKDPLISALVGALFLGSAAILALGVVYHQNYKHAQKLSPQLAASQQARAIGAALASESLEYRQQHNATALDPILISVGVNPNAAVTPKR
ncbi:MAG TPA: hypothetical protein VL527_03790 [Dongiaceae bacterium]|jgi:hypothetical protein|nr:hypothetical protein [Dongiaceae bacterium]